MVLRQYDYCLFDLDGTLVDADPSFVRETFDEVGDRLGRRFTDREATTLWHGLGGARNDILRAWGLDPPAFWRAFDDVADPVTRAGATFLYDDAAVVADLDCPVGLVTHCPPTVTAEVLSTLDVRDWFDAVVCCGEGTGWKPDPDPVEAAMGDLGVERGDAGMLAGDADIDVAAAWNAGLDGVHVERHDPNDRGHCVLGDYRVRSLAELQVAADGGRVASDD